MRPDAASDERIDAGGPGYGAARFVVSLDTGSRPVALPLLPISQGLEAARWPLQAVLRVRKKHCSVGLDACNRPGIGVLT
jgi:hypothetical protein